MANHTIVLPPNDANQENVAPSADALANVRSTAREALAAHIDRSAKEPGKRSRGPRSSDAEKVESLLCFVDGAEIAFALVDDAKRYLLSIGNVGNSNGPLASVGIVIEALNHAINAGRRQLKGARLAINNTSAKQSAAQSHQKLTQLDRQRFGEQHLQRRALAPTNPRKMLQLAITNTNQKLSALRQSAATISDVSDSSAVIAPRSKKRKASPIDVRMLTPEEKKQIIRDSIRLPRPRGGNLVYSVAEAVDVVSVLVRQNDEQNKHSPRFYLDAIKQKMIDDVRVPVQRSQLNRLLGAAKEGKTLPTFWNQCGRPEIMSLAELRAKFDDHAKRDGNCWTLEQTKNALINQTKEKLTVAGLDSSIIESPYKQTIRAYHSALMSMPDLLLRKCNPKNALREASETSIHNMLSYICSVLNG